MKSTIVIALGMACFPSLAAEPTAKPSSEAKTVQSTIQPTASAFCGQSEVQRLFLKTEIGKQLQARRQEAQSEALRQAMLQAVNEGKISVQEYMQYEYGPAIEKK
jgi:hypothetical protein